MLFALSSGVIAVVAVLVAASLEMRRPVMWVGTVALCWQLHIVLTGRVLSLLGLLGAQWAWLAVDLVVLVAAGAWWVRRGRPTVAPPITVEQIRSWFGSGWLLAATAILATTVVVLYGVLLVATLVIPQGLDDVLTAYLPRAAYWIQQGDLSPFPASPYNSVQVSYPVNAQMSVVRAIVLSRGERFVGLDQWCSAFVGATAIGGLARGLGARSTHAFVVALLWLLVPTVGAQAGLALTDLVSIAGLTMTVLFGYVGWRDQDRRLLMMSSLWLGLALGTKQTLLFVLPSLALLLVAVYVLGRARRSLWWRWVLTGVPVVGLLGLTDYVTNWVHFGHPLGDPDSFTLFAVEATPGERWSALFPNLRRATIDMFLGNLPRTTIDDLMPLDVTQYDIFLGRYLTFGQPWTGLFICSTVLVGVVAGVALAIRRRDARPLVMLLPAVAYVATLFWTRSNYTGAFSRYLLVPLALLLPVAAAGFSSLRVPTRAVRIAAGVLVVLVACGVSAESLVTTPRLGTRPLVGDSVWSASRTDLIARSSGFDRPLDLVASIEFLEDCQGDTDRIGIMLPSKFPQSVLFGPRYDRHVIQYDDPFPARIDAGFLAEEEITLVFVEESLLGQVTIDSGTVDVATFGSLSVVTRRDGGRPLC